MTDSKDSATGGEGERLHAQRRRRFWLLIGMLALIGAVGGFVHGFIEGSGSAGSPLSGTIGTIGVVAVAIAAALGSWLYFAKVDEVELADNLWGSLIGFYVYAITLPAWWALNRLEQAPPPDQWIIYGAAMIAAVIVYFFRKWQLR